MTLVLLRALLASAVLLVAATGIAHAESFLQARCNQHRIEWRGPRRSSDRAFQDADAHNRAHRGHDARVLVVAHD